MNITEEQKQIGLEEGWDLETVNKGYAIFTSDFVDGATHIEMINCMEVFETDLQATEQAIKDGIKIIKNLPKEWEYSDVGFIDTEENREKINKELKKEKLGKIF